MRRLHFNENGISDADLAGLNRRFIHAEMGSSIFRDGAEDVRLQADSRGINVDHPASFIAFI